MIFTRGPANRLMSRRINLFTILSVSDMAILHEVKIRLSYWAMSLVLSAGGTQKAA
jgi:hypothetical protein